MNPMPLIAVVGNPNAGKSALFNMLTGARQKVGNYPGVTVERKAGRFSFPDGRPVELVDLPGSYSLDPASPDEAVTRDVVLGKQAGERLPDGLLVVLDATNLDNHLRFALELIDLGHPTVVALNMVDLARRDGLEISAERLSQALGVPVIETVAVRRIGKDAISEALAAEVLTRGEVKSTAPHDPRSLSTRARAIAATATLSQKPATAAAGWLDRVALNPVAGPLIFAA
jgi:ferrous iron transport protein B